MKPKLDLMSTLNFVVDTSVEAAVCFLTTFETISWRDIAVPRVVATRKVDALAYVFDCITDNESVDTACVELPWNAEFENGPSPYLFSGIFLAFM